MNPSIDLPPTLLLFLSNVSWHGQRQRPQHLATRFARHWRVLWLEPAMLHRMMHLRPRQVSDNVYALTLPDIPHNARSGLIRSIASIASTVPFARMLVRSIQQRTVQRAVNQLTRRSNIIVFVENFQLIEAVTGISVAVKVFDYIDNAFGFTKYPAYVNELWRQAINQAQEVIITSTSLGTQVQSVRTRNVTLVSNGVEWSRFVRGTKCARPMDLPLDDKPIVGYVGSIYPWVDFALLENLCASLGIAHLVLIGEVHPDVRQAVSRLKQYGNFHLLGFRPYERIPEYMAYFDVGIIPFRRTKLTEFVNPVKLYEYAAAGIPIVSTNFSDDLEEYRDVVQVAPSEEGFLQGVKNKLQASAKTAQQPYLQEWAKQHDWSIKADTIVDLIRRHL